MTATPQRIQLGRTRGFRLQVVSRALNGLVAVRVTRPGPLGNPFRVGKGNRCWWCLRSHDDWVRFPTKEAASRHAVQLYAEKVEADATLQATIKEHLSGLNVACSCPLDDEYGRRFPCHGDYLLRVANAPASTPAPMPA